MTILPHTCKCPQLVFQIFLTDASAKVCKSDTVHLIHGGDSTPTEGNTGYSGGSRCNVPARTLLRVRASSHRSLAIFFGGDFDDFMKLALYVATSSFSP